MQLRDTVEGFHNFQEFCHLHKCMFRWGLSLYNTTTSQYTELQHFTSNYRYISSHNNIYILSSIHNYRPMGMCLVFNYIMNINIQCDWHVQFSAVSRISFKTLVKRTRDSEDNRGLILHIPLITDFDPVFLESSICTHPSSSAIPSMWPPNPA